jgi:serine/threonine-protein kinase
MAAPSRSAKTPRRRLPLPRTIAGRRRLTTLVVLLGAAAAGYLTTCVLYPRPLLREDRPVARVIGLPVAQAEAELTQLGFKVKVSGEEPDPQIPAGHVTWQEPPADLVVPGGTAVELVRSAGPAPVAVPDVSQFDLDDARRVVTAAGLKVGEVDSVPSQVEPGVVVASRPGAGVGRPPGTSIDLVVSRGPATIRVPNVVGLPATEARERLEDAGLAVGRVARVARRGPPGTVLEQRPAAGAMSARGGRVDLLVSEVD